MNDLRRRATRGAAWLLALRLTQRGLRTLRLIVLARLIAPDQFGLLGAALLAVDMLRTISETGVRTTLIQQKEVTRDDLDTAWTLQVVRGLALAGLCLVGGNAWAAWLGDPGVAEVLIWVAPVLLLEAFGNVATVEFERKLDFRRRFLHQGSGAIVDVVLSVALAIILRDVRALAVGIVAGQAVQLIAGYVLMPRLPRPRIARGSLVAQWKFGRWILLSTVLIFLGKQGDDLVVGRLVGVEWLAFYQMAWRIAGLPAAEISNLAATVLFPTLASVKDDRDRLRAGYVQVVQLTSVVAFPLCAAVFVLGGPATERLLTAAWLPMVPALQVLALGGAFRAIVGPGPLWLSVGRPDLRTKLQAIDLATLAVAIVPLTMLYGITGAAIAATARVVVGKLAALAFTERWFGGTWRPVSVALVIPALAAIGAGSLARATIGAAGPSVVGLAAAVVVLAATYYVLLRLLDRLTGRRIGPLVRRQVDALGLPLLPSEKPS